MIGLYLAAVAGFTLGVLTASLLSTIARGDS